MRIQFMRIQFMRGRIMRGRKHTWLLAALLILSVAAGLYHIISVTAKFTYGGDDCVNMISDIVRFRDLSWWDCLSLWIKEKWGAVTAVFGRYFPLAGMIYPIKKFVMYSIFRYRAYIAAVTYIDILLTGTLLYRITRNRYTAAVCIAAAPLMLNINYLYPNNGMYTYQGLVQMCLMMALIAMHLLVSFCKTGKWYFAILSGIFSLASCLIYEQGYVLAIPCLFLVFFFDNQKKGIYKWLEYLRRVCVNLTAVTLGLGLYLTASVRMGSVSSDTKPVFNLAAIIKVMLMHLWAAFPTGTLFAVKDDLKFAAITPGDVIAPLLTAALLFFFFYRMALGEKEPDFVLGYESAGRSKRDYKIGPENIKSNFISSKWEERKTDAMLSGEKGASQGIHDSDAMTLDPSGKRGIFSLTALWALMLCVLPAGIIAVTEKFQDSNWSDWDRGWIQCVITSIGYAVLLGLLMTALARAFRKSGTKGKTACTVLAGFLSIALLASGILGHMAARASSRDGRMVYEVLLRDESLRNGAFDDCPDTATVLTNCPIWGDSNEAISIYIDACTRRKLDGVYVDHKDMIEDPDNVWLFYQYRTKAKKKQPASLIITGKASGENLDRVNNGKIYIDLDQIKEGRYMHYITLKDGVETEVALPWEAFASASGGSRRYFYELKDDEVLVDSVSYLTTNKVSN